MQYFVILIYTKIAVRGIEYIVLARITYLE